MPRSYTVEQEDGLAIVRFIAQPSPDDVCSAMDAVSALPENDLRLWDVSHDGLNMATEQLIEIAEYGKVKFQAPSKVAFIAPGDLAFGLMRIYEVKSRSSTRSIEIMVFRSEPEARAWLKQ